MTDLPRFRPISARLIRRIVWLSAACMLIVLALQTLVLWYEHRQRMTEVVATVGNTHVPLLGVALWDIEPRAVELQVQAIADWPEVGHVRVRAATGQVFEAGNPALAHPSQETYAVDVPAPRGGPPVGRLELVADPGHVRAAVWRNALQLLLGYAVLVSALCVLIAVMLRKELQTPLERMARFAADLTPEELTTPLQMARTARGDQLDEIDVLADGIGKLQAGLRGHIANLDGLVAERTAQLEQLVEEIHRLSMTDALTGAFNRRSIDERLPSEVERAHRYGRPLAVLFVDLDHFKHINDSHGHPVGDTVLRHMVALVRSHLRSGVDWMARYGGEEFLVVLPETELAAAVTTAERLREHIERERIALDGDFQLSVTSSFGVTSCRAEDDSGTLLARADALLYEAKLGGRNRVAFSS